MSERKSRTDYDEAFKIEAVKLSETSTQSVKDVAKDLGIPVSNCSPNNFEISHVA